MQKLIQFQSNSLISYTIQRSYTLNFPRFKIRSGNFRLGAKVEFYESEIANLHMISNGMQQSQFSIGTQWMGQNTFSLTLCGLKLIFGDVIDSQIEFNFNDVFIV